MARGEQAFTMNGAPCFVAEPGELPYGVGMVVVAYDDGCARMLRRQARRELGAVNRLRRR